MIPGCAHNEVLTQQDEYIQEDYVQNMESKSMPISKHSGEFIILISIFILLFFPACASTEERSVLLDPLVTACPPTIVEIRCSSPQCDWEERDNVQLEISRRRCRDLFGDRTCLKRLVKVRPHGYTATCRKLL